MKNITQGVAATLPEMIHCTTLKLIYRIIGDDASMRILLKHIDITFMNTLYNLYDDLK